MCGRCTGAAETGEIDTGAMIRRMKQRASQRMKISLSGLSGMSEYRVGG
jgi:hypothetical protein